MPQFTINLTQKAVDRLQAVVARTNEHEGTDYTLMEWITLHLNETAIAQELAAAVQAIQEREQREAPGRLQAAIREARDALLAELQKHPTNGS